MNSINELAKMFKERENETYLGPITGSVVSVPPNIKVSCFDGKVILDKTNIVIASQVLSNYQRKLKISDVSTTATSDITEIIGELNFTDTLKTGDEVILVPSPDLQTYFLIDKAVRL